MNMNINSVFVLNQNNTPDTMQVIVDNIPGILVVKGSMEVSNMAEPHNYESQLDNLVTIGRDVAEFGIGYSEQAPLERKLTAVR